MEDHRKDEHGYLCTICQQKLSEWGDLKNHMLIDHGGYLSSEFNSGQPERHFLIVVLYLVNLFFLYCHPYKVDSQQMLRAKT
jgi:hypothetical protein